MTDEWLRAAMPAVEQGLLASLPPPEDCDHVFSPAFVRKMRPLLRRQAHPALYALARRAAGLFLASLLGASAWLAVDTDARASFFQWVREVYQTHIVYRFAGEVVGEDLPVYRPAWVPEGYEEVATTDGMIIYCSDQTNRTADFTYGPMQEGSALYVVDTDKAIIKDVEVNGLPGEFYLSTDTTISNSLLWMDESLNQCFSISGFLTESDMLHMAESISLVKSTK